MALHWSVGVHPASQTLHRCHHARHRPRHLRFRSRFRRRNRRRRHRCHRSRLQASRLRLRLRQRNAIGPRSRDQATGISANDLWITSKLWNDKHPTMSFASCRKSLADLRLDYLDLYLVHWPFPNFHPPGATSTRARPEARPYIHENFMKTWRQMEKLVDLGLARHIGTSNMTIPKLRTAPPRCPHQTRRQ